jgi:threonine dehydrogenase-like Zn-dependent dehydrogenase
MRGTVMYGPGEVRVEEREEPRILEPTDVVIRVSAACVCGSDLWPYRGIEDLAWPAPMGHEYVGIVEEIGAEVEAIKLGQFVVGSFWGSDNTCEICQAGYQSACVNRIPMGSLGAQAERLRIPFADGTLVATPEIPSDDLIPSLVSASDVLGTGWFGAVAAEAGPGKTVAVVGDGAVGLLAVLAATQLGAERVIAMSRPSRGSAWRASSAQPRSSRSAATTASSGSRSSGTGSARTPSSRRSAPKSRCCRRSTRPALAGTSASSASPTASSCRRWICSGASRTCTADLPRCAGSCPS